MLKGPPLNLLVPLTAVWGLGTLASNYKGSMNGVPARSPLTLTAEGGPRAINRCATDLAVSLSEGAGEQRVKYDDRLVEIPDEHSLQLRVGPRRRILASTTTATATRRP